MLSVELRRATKPFKGIIKLDVRDSVPDWEPYLPAKAPANAPNILFVLYDDTGQAAWSPFGGRINMPTLQKLADRGLMYSQWHTTALCSPTRSALLTGRNHHLNGMAAITEGANGFPGPHGRVPAQCATLAQILQDSGWSTFWLGKDHNVPEQPHEFGGHLCQMTIYSHNVVMKQVRIAELKSRLSEYLRAVRRGETIAVLDRDTPVAHLVPVRDRPALRIRKPRPGTPAPGRVRLPKPATLELDIVKLLLEERQGHR